MKLDVVSAVSAIGSPAIVAECSDGELRELAGKLLPFVGTVLGELLKRQQQEGVEELKAAGDRLLSLQEIADRMGCSVANLRRGWRAGRYPFILRDGGRMVGSLDGMERWIRAKTDKLKRGAGMLGMMMGAMMCLSGTPKFRHIGGGGLRSSIHGKTWTSQG